ncbi:MAG TPA: hypothetical protein VGR91_19735 [Stellaceae bacterium]|nr:hypothetical protein [Stellaceae bacterium]
MDKRGGDGLRVGAEDLARMAEAAEVMRACRRELAGKAGGVIAEATEGAAAVDDWRHYPEGEVYDPHSHAQYFYHAHPPAVRTPGEHGHFHTFLRAEGMPGAVPLLLPEIAVADAPAPTPQGAPLQRGSRSEVCHLVAIAVDPRGEPIRLFTTNRWVTGEAWYRADDVIAILDRFRIARGALCDRWLGAMLALFRREIALVLRQRDDAVMGWRRRRRSHVFEDPRFEICSSVAVDLDAQLARVERMRGEGPAAASAGRRRRLPPMAEGWG